MTILGIIDVSLLAGAAGVLLLYLVKLRKRFEELERRAEKAEGDVNRVLYFIGHDLRASIHGIAGMARLLEKTPCSEEQQEYAQLMRYTSLKIHYTAAELVAFYRGRRKKEPLVESEFSPARFFRKESVFLRRFVSELGCTLTLELPPERDRTIGDKTKIGRLAFALVSAAAERSPESRVELEVSLTSAGLRLGITAFRDPPEEGRLEGGDIHIETARVLTDLLNGTLSLDGYAGPYTALLPLTRIDNPGGAEISTPEDIRPIVAPAGPKPESGISPTAETGRALPRKEGSKEAASGDDSKAPRLLIAEDEVINQFYLKNICDDAGWEADIVGNGRDAYRRFEKEEYDIVILDIEMPILAGIETVRKMREIDPERRTPILALSAYSEARKTAEYALAGFDGHISKPFTERGFYRKVGQYISGNYSAS